MPAISLCVALLSALMTPAAAGPLMGPSITVKLVVPPPEVLSGVSSISIDDIEGYNGDTVRNELRSALLDTERTTGGGGGELASALIGGAAGVAGELAGGMVGGSAGGLVSGLTRGAGAMVAENIGPDTVILDDGLHVDVFELVEGASDASLSGEVSVRDEVSDYKAKQAKRDGDGNIVKNSDGKTVYEEISCKKREVYATVDWSVLSDDGTVLAQDALKLKGDDAKCGSERNNIASTDAIAATMLPGVGTAIANSITPSWNYVKVPLEKSKNLKEDNKLARQGAHMQALCGFRGLTAFDSYDTDALYNLGVMHEVMGHYDEAYESYQDAIGVDNHKSATKALSRLRARQGQVDTLTDAYELTFTVDDLDYSECPQIPDGRKGSLKKDVTLLASPGGAETAPLPKGMRIWVTEEEGDMVKVATMDGQEGWVESKRVK